MDLEKQRAITTFYREEFEKQIEQLHATGFLDDSCESHISRVCHRLLEELDELSCRSQFPLIAETILARFETLTQLGRRTSRRTN